MQAACCRLPCILPRTEKRITPWWWQWTARRGGLWVEGSPGRSTHVSVLCAGPPTQSRTGLSPVILLSWRNPALHVCDSTSPARWGVCGFPSPFLLLPPSAILAILAGPFCNRFPDAHLGPSIFKKGASWLWPSFSRVSDVGFLGSDEPETFFLVLLGWLPSATRGPSGRKKPRQLCASARLHHHNASHPARFKPVRRPTPNAQRQNHPPLHVAHRTHETEGSNRMLTSTGPRLDLQADTPPTTLAATSPAAF